MDFAVIMAGGSGQRLWPLSRKGRPKQVLQLIQGQTLLGQCYHRLCPSFSLDRIFVLTNAAYVDLVCQTLPDLPRSNVIAEPMIRDTAAAIGLAASILTAIDPEAQMVVVTADHVIEPGEMLLEVLQAGLGYVGEQPDALVTFGIKPTFPATQYGYLQCSEGICEVQGHSVHEVVAFKEKPPLDVAQQYLDAGNTWWNSGMFVWKAQTVLEYLARFLPDAMGPLRTIKEAWDTPEWQSVVAQEFGLIPKISIDFAVMERAERVVTLALPCHWLDLGAFTSLSGIQAPDEQGNVVLAQKAQLLDTQDSIVVTEDQGHLIATLGLNGMVVAHSPDATLVCPVEQLDRLKELLTEIDAAELHDYL